MKKKLTALFLAVVMCMTISVPAFSVDSVEKLISNVPILEAESVCTNEYDYIVTVRRAFKSESNLLNISNEEFSYINSGAIEAELLHRASLPDDILSNHYCYTAKDIEILREYDGSPLEENPQMRSVTATLTATLTPLVKTTTRIGLLYSWRWDVQPLNRYSDIVAMVWEGTYEDGRNNNMRLDMDNSFANIQYFATSEDQQGITLDVETNSQYHGGFVEFPMGRYFGPYHWAKSGGLYLYADLVNTTSGPELYELSAHGEYGHYMTDIGIGVDLSAGSLAISFDGTLTTCGSKNIVINP